MEGHKTLKKKTQERKAKYKIQYFSNKEELDKLRDNITLHRWKILSKNYNLGKRIWGTAFSKLRLSEDMDIPNTTVCRCLALDKINERNWALNKEGKISVFKLAMIASLKNHQFQDQIVDIVISDKLSTCAIKEFRINNVRDMNEVRHRLAVDKGYSRKDSAYVNFRTWIDRGDRFLKMGKSNLPDAKVKEIETELLKLKIEIIEFIR